MLSPSASDIAQQFPHQLLKVPLTSGVVNASVTFCISTLKVTVAVCACTLSAEKNTKKLSISLVKYFILTCLIIKVQKGKKKIT